MISGLELHPFLGSLARLLRHRIDAFPGLCPLAFDPKIEAIRGVADEGEVFISNELYRCKGFRKLHLEIAQIGLGLQILHCVFFPDPRFDLPIFGVDVVVGPAGISAAIVDLSPVAPVLSTKILKGLEELSIPCFKQVRELPSWGTIFSPYVQFIRPVDLTEERHFLDLVDNFLEILHQAVFCSSPNSLTDASTIQRHSFQTSYCLQQKNNDKTRSVLEKAFTPQWADRYIEEVLFECPPLS